ncbi:hypothetical protein NCER_101617 [Vairimorpha ceranae BRL01]|uniref:Endonuclease/exonuclease/phosphatase domain-containing protein n=2 Tax=Vairimorpha ceranae TaxID=40302 RepID=C4VAF0_VAIC1|nr:hydrolase of the alpha beta-hydrolase [Vairimorpha ceranae]EEQ81805.1 hypothetical protein NCER_101617 [Vairimorpha ceranae BRL01]KAF5141421.1 hypothetical protein G9O61_00g004200 [Vairimorpha ceranae]KKO74658.1 hydrolase of the alpha beta-hydrolase [Vairimorpha ceranae]
MIIILLVSKVLSYVVSKYDPELALGQKEIVGFLKEHNKTVDVKNFGDLSFITYNMEKKEALNSVKQTNELIKLVDNTHVPVICLQECELDQLKELSTRMLPHYGIAEGKESKVINPTNGNETFLPILYDTEELRFLQSGRFKTNDPVVKNTYATWAIFNHVKKNLDFVVININLYSTKSLVDSLELASILYDINATPSIKNKIIFISGTINGMSDNTNTLINKGFVKLSNYNKNDGELKNTMNTYMDVLNNIERDFILALNTKTIKAQPVYSSVLRLFKYGARFPVHSIVTINNH